MVGTRNSGRPGGNPQIRQISKLATGPKSIEGKFKGKVLAGVLKHGTYSKIVKRMMKCDNCPAGVKKIVRIIKGKPIKIPVLPRCPHYQEHGKCRFQPQDFIYKMKALYKLEKIGFDEKAIYEMMIKDAFADAAFSREMDLMEKGRPAHYTKEFSDLAMTHLERLYKLKYGELNRNINVNFDMSDAIVEAYKRRVKKDEEM